MSKRCDAGGMSSRGTESAGPRLVKLLVMAGFPAAFVPDLRRSIQCPSSQKMVVLKTYAIYSHPYSAEMAASNKPPTPRGVTFAEPVTISYVRPLTPYSQRGKNTHLAIKGPKEGSLVDVSQELNGPQYFLYMTQGGYPAEARPLSSHHLCVSVPFYNHSPFVFPFLPLCYLTCLMYV